MTACTDGCVIACTTLWLPCFVIRFIVNFLPVFPTWCLHCHFPIRCHWSLIQSGPRLSHKGNTDKLQIWLIEWWHVGLAGSLILFVPPRSMVEKRFSISNALRYFSYPVVSGYWLVEVTGFSHCHELKIHLNLLVCGSSIALQPILDPFSPYLMLSWLYHCNLYLIAVLLGLLVRLYLYELF